MKYVGFKRVMGSYPCFSIEQINAHFPGFDTRRLVEWQQKGYIHRLRNSFYCFSDRDFTDEFLSCTANELCRPSYISLEWALYRYGIMHWHPGYFPITSCTTSKKRSYNTPAGRFVYRQLKPEMYFGYRLQREDDHSYLIAQPEKALVDYMYYHHEIKELWDVRALNWDREILSRILSLSVLTYFAVRCGSKATVARVDLIGQYLRYGGHHGGGRPVPARW